MVSNELINFFNIMYDKRQAFEIGEGILQDIRGLTGRVSFVGNPVSQEVFILQGAVVSLGNRCLCVRPKSSPKWIVLGSFGTRQTGYSPERAPEKGYEIYPPKNLTAFDILPGACMWSWYAPPEKAIVFEIQSNTSASETGATTDLRTRGSHFIKASAVNLFIRVRSIQSDYKHSAWSEWVECAPGTATGGGSGTVTSVALSVPAELSVAGSPITTSGTFTVSWANESANKIFAGPASGGAAAPTFRDQVLNDSPTIASQRLIGRATAGSGHFEELAIGAGLYISASTLYASGTGGGSSDWTHVSDFLHPTTTTDRVVIGSSSIDAAAALEVNSTTGGVLIPRMTTAQRNALSAPVGMMIFNTTTNQFEFYQGDVVSPMSEDELLEMIWIGGF